ncbi:unnamed protein product (macronuclear) [Paramecium tetraurelia]|uniref:Uncharacterized protein n=1 Tax=Paramecium tetraurelia TaxID=5888 RepID=A0C4Z8_PARTE|nr:uncharacterized protein GSPATT00006364001 [Paramecium tetraurelia]CAK65865.1 unnamed protein product [Paramecium tetraurelia]|eukprot:XP_001433262.1 hypothetical protein (macronuclear) [Paramecium tetraurelia strain d4-2]
MNNLKSKNSAPLDKPQKYPNSDILTIPMHKMRMDINNNNNNRLNSQQSSKNLEILRQSHQSSTSNLRLDNSHNKSSENLITKTPTRTKVCTFIDKIPQQLQNNFSLSPHSVLQKPLMKQEDDQQNIISFCHQKSNLVIDHRKEQLILQLQQAQQLLIQKDQENQKLQEINNRLYDENQKLFNQGEDMLKDIETMRQNFDQQNNEYMMLKQQNQQLIEDVRLIQNERNQTQSHSDQILNHKNYEIQQLQRELKEYQQLLQNKDQTISNLKQQLDNLKQQEIARQHVNQYQKNSEKSYLNNINQQIETAQKFQQQDLNYKGAQMESEIQQYQAQLEFITSEKEICEQKLVDLQTIINQFALNEKQQNMTSNSNGNVIYQKQSNKLKQIVQIQKKQIESQQKTIMNQHYEIQNLQNLLYSIEQDSQSQKNSNIFYEKISIQQLNISDTGEKETNLREPIVTKGFQGILLKQQQGPNIVMEDTFRNMQKQQDLFNSTNDQ